ncbi:hypothetical protein E2I00_003872, partial [Balaenoptera physalus]
EQQEFSVQPQENALPNWKAMKVKFQRNVFIFKKIGSRLSINRSIGANGTKIPCDNAWHYFSHPEGTALCKNKYQAEKISFNPQGNRLLTGSSDKTARIWDVQTGQCLQVLEGHTDEIFSCAFNYKGDIIITGRGEINTIDSVFLSNWLLESLSWIPKGDTPIPTRVPSSSWCLLCPLFNFSCIAEPQE